MCYNDVASAGQNTAILQLTVSQRDRDLQAVSVVKHVGEYMESVEPMELS